MSTQRSRVRLLPLAALGTAALAAAQGTATPSAVNAMKACAAIASPTDRLACYDKLSDQAPPAPATGTPVPPPAASVPVPVAAPVVAPVAPPIAPPPTVAPAPALSNPPLAAPASTPPAPPAQPTKESFGLYSAEHPIVKPAASLTATVVGFGMAPNGHPTITLDGGAIWELDNADPLLAKGDSVIIRRAVLGSYILTTNTGRTHRVYRQR